MATQSRASRRGHQVRDRDTANHPPSNRLTPRSALVVGALVVAGALLSAAGVIAIIRSMQGSDGPDELVIYSSLPQRERLHPAAASGSRVDVVRNERTTDMENAMRLALAQAKHKAGDFDVAYRPLDDSDARGETPAAGVEANARRAADDEHTAAYIGEFTSDATQLSLPILSRARVAQISVSSTRVGLTTHGDQSDGDEPGRYYRGYRNFVRLIPTTAVHARALLGVLRRDHCDRIALIDDGSSYGRALAEDLRAQNDRRVMRFAYHRSVGPEAPYMPLVETARRGSVDCFVYSGIRNANTVEIFTAFADGLPKARLYGTNGVVTASFVEPGRGLSPEVADRVTVMVPPYDRRSAAGFFDAFASAHGKTADTYALYAYEAMRLVLDAIRGSKSGRREQIVGKLFGATRSDTVSAIGKYQITKTGDTSLMTYGVSRIVDGRLTVPTRAPLFGGGP